MRHVEIHLNVTLGHAFLRYYETDETRTETDHARH